MKNKENSKTTASAKLKARFIQKKTLKLVPPWTITRPRFFTIIHIVLPKDEMSLMTSSQNYTSTTHFSHAFLAFQFDTWFINIPTRGSHAELSGWECLWSSTIVCLTRRRHFLEMNKTFSNFEINNSAKLNNVFI